MTDIAGTFRPKPPKRTALPPVPRAYHEFYRAPRFRWWKPLVAIGGVGIVWIVFSVIVSILVMMFDLGSGAATQQQYESGQPPTTPALFLGNNLTIIAFIPLALLANRVVFGQEAGFLASIHGFFRWRMFGRCMLIAAPFFAVLFGLGFLLDGLPDLAVDAHTVPMIFIILLTTPLQCAGEEYAVRGLLARCVGSWFPVRNLGWVVSTFASSAVFVMLHDAGDVWLNLFYACFAITSSVLVWRTGGLEASIALHVVNNLMSMVLLPFTDMSDLFDRQAGVGSPSDLIQLVFVVAPAAIIVWQARRMHMATVAAPGLPFLLDSSAQPLVSHVF